MDRWQNKVAVVTGASSGIGAAACKALVAQGMIVVGLARRLERMEELKASLPVDQQKRFHAVRCDVSKEEDILKTFAWVDEQLGGVAVLLNNAGIGRRTEIVEAGNTQKLREVLDTNVMGVALCTREAFQSMKKHNFDGHVLIINSVAGHTVPMIFGRSMNIYAPSKHAVTAMTEVLRQEFQIHKTQIKITSISPGAVDTEIIEDAKKRGIVFPMLHAENIADAVVYCIQTPPHVQVHEMIIKPVGESF